MARKVDRWYGVGSTEREEGIMVQTRLADGSIDEVSSSS
jgi:hypothetical protein